MADQDKPNEELEDVEAHGLKEGLAVALGVGALAAPAASGSTYPLPPHPADDAEAAFVYADANLPVTGARAGVVGEAARSPRPVVAKPKATKAKKATKATKAKKAKKTQPGQSSNRIFREE